MIDPTGLARPLASSIAPFSLAKLALSLGRPVLRLLKRFDATDRRSAAFNVVSAQWSGDLLLIFIVIQIVQACVREIDCLRTACKNIFARTAHDNGQSAELDDVANDKNAGVEDFFTFGGAAGKKDDKNRENA